MTLVWTTLGYTEFEGIGFSWFDSDFQTKHLSFNIHIYLRLVAKLINQVTFLHGTKTCWTWGRDWRGSTTKIADFRLLTNRRGALWIKITSQAKDKNRAIWIHTFFVRMEWRPWFSVNISTRLEFCSMPKVRLTVRRSPDFDHSYSLSVTRCHQVASIHSMIMSRSLSNNL